MIEEVHKRGGTNNCNDPEVQTCCTFLKPTEKKRNTVLDRRFFFTTGSKDTRRLVSPVIFFSPSFSPSNFFFFFFLNRAWTFSESSKFLSLSFLLFDFF